MQLYKEEEFIPESKECYLFSCAESSLPHWHTHEFYEIAYIYENSGNHFVEDMETVVKAGEYILISPKVKHYIASFGDDKLSVRICNLLIRKKYFEEKIKELSGNTAFKNTELYKILSKDKPFCLHFADTSDCSIKRYIEAIKDECDLKENGIDDIADNCLKNLILKTGHICDIQMGKKEPIVIRDTNIENLIGYIKANIHLPLNLELLAEQIHFSPEYLSRYFKKNTGKNLSAYIMELRMAKAKQLLETTKLPVSEICYMCGYSSVSNFRKYFSKAFKMSPREYRTMAK